MILIIGGMCQGKHSFCNREFPDAEVIDHYEERIRKELREGKDPVTEAEKWIETEIPGSSGEMLMEAAYLQKHGNELLELTGTEDHSVNESHSINACELAIIMNEVGSGVVPMDRDERIWREAVGRVSCLFAERAEQVYRLIAGIPQRLK